MPVVPTPIKKEVAELKVAKPLAVNDGVNQYTFTGLKTYISKFTKLTEMFYKTEGRRISATREGSGDITVLYNFLYHQGKKDGKDYLSKIPKRKQ